MGPENLREYSTKEVRLLRGSAPERYSSEPNTLTAASDRLLMKFTDGPRDALDRSA